MNCGRCNNQLPIGINGFCIPCYNELEENKIPKQEPFYPSRLDFFTAAALSNPFNTGLNQKEHIKNSINYAKEIIKLLDKEEK